MKHAPVNRLESVPDVGQGATDDDGHRVVEVAPLHLNFDANRLDSISGTARRGLNGHGLCVLSCST